METTIVNLSSINLGSRPKQDRAIPLILAALLTVATQQLAAGSSGTEGAAFLDIPVGSAPAALGSAYTALATDAYAPVWNAAGLGSLDSTQIAGQHLSYLESMHYEFMSIVHPLGDVEQQNATHRGIGLSAQYFGSGDLTGTDLEGNNTGTFTSYYGSYNLAYGQSFGSRLSLGLAAKWINARIQDVTANAYGVDLGSLYKLTDHIRLAATVNNIGTQLKFLSDGDPLPLAVHLGGAYEPDAHWLLSTEGVYSKTGMTSFHAGAGWRPVTMVSLRLGYKNDTQKGLSAIAGLTTGIGLHLWGQELDYAWAPYGDLGNAQYFSMLLRFGDHEQDKRNLIQYQDIKRHRSVRANQKDKEEPEYQQLMQLLSDDDAHLAKATGTISDTR